MKAYSLVKVLICVVLVLVINTGIQVNSKEESESIQVTVKEEIAENSNEEVPLNEETPQELKINEPPEISFGADNYVIGEKVIINVNVQDPDIVINLKKALKISRPIVVKDIENYKDDFITLKMINQHNYIGFLRTDIGEFFPGEYEFTFSYTDKDGKIKSVEKLIQVGKISITSQNLDFALLNRKYQSAASLFIESSSTQSKELTLSIIPKDENYSEKDFKYDKKITVGPGKNEYYVKFSLPKNIFQKERFTFVNDDIKSKIQIILKNSSNQVLYKVAIPMQFVIGSYLEYNLEFIIISITVIIFLIISSYQVWKESQPAILFGTLYCKKPKNTKTYLATNTWNLSDLKSKEGVIGTSQKALIDLPLLNPEEAILVAKGTNNNSTLWIKPAVNGIVEINNKPIAEETQIGDGDDIFINGYLFSWKK